MTIDTKAIFKGTDGDVWVNTGAQEVKIGSVKFFTLKQANQFESIDSTNFNGSDECLLGFTLEGEIKRFKIDNTFINIMEEYKNGVQPDISIVGKVENKTTKKLQRVKVKRVTFGGMNLLEIEPKKTIEEAIPFKAGDYKWLDNI